MNERAKKGKRSETKMGCKIEDMHCNMDFAAMDVRKTSLEVYKR